MKKLLLVLLAFMLVAPVAFAHGGGTDSNGGHWDHNAGEYHYHHGYSAHSHPNGVCPYSIKASSGSKAVLDLNERDLLEATGNVNFRRAANSSSSIICTIPSGDLFYYAGMTSGKWHFVEYKEQTGWVHNDYVDLVRPFSSSSSNTSSDGVLANFFKNAIENAATAKPTQKPRASIASKSNSSVSIKASVYIFLSGFGVGMVFLFLYSRKANERETVIRLEGEKESRASYNAGIRWAQNDLFEKQQALEKREKEFEEKSSAFMLKVEQIKSELPPPEAYCFVQYAQFYSGYGRSLYHRLDCSCISSGKRIALYEAKMRGLEPCPRCHPPITAPPVDFKNLSCR